MRSSVRRAPAGLGGAGLGLAIVRGIMELHGAAALTSMPGRGMRVPRPFPAGAG